MRVIAGTARRLPLKTPKGKETRPTTDRIKETLFNMLAPLVPGSRFLDLFAGSGQIGIEALSRGADYAVFVEQGREAAECIRENLAFTRLEPKARLIFRDAAGALRIMQGEAPFDLVFMDPPYESGLVPETLRVLRGAGLVTPDTLVVAETDLKTSPDIFADTGFVPVRTKTYKTNAHVFLRPAP